MELMDNEMLNVDMPCYTLINALITSCSNSPIDKEQWDVDSILDLSLTHAVRLMVTKNG
jgi:hypothetical protein